MTKVWQKTDVKYKIDLLQARVNNNLFSPTLQALQYLLTHENTIKQIKYQGDPNDMAYQTADLIHSFTCHFTTQIPTRTYGWHTDLSNKGEKQYPLTYILNLEIENKVKGGELVIIEDGEETLIPFVDNQMVMIPTWKKHKINNYEVDDFGLPSTGRCTVVGLLSYD